MTLGGGGEGAGCRAENLGARGPVHWRTLLQVRTPACSPQTGFTVCQLLLRFSKVKK